MAKKAKAKKKAAPKRFLIATSDCGSLSQLEIDTYHQFASAADAKASIKKSLEDGDWGTGITFFVIEVVAKGVASNVTWQDKPTTLT